MISARNEPPEPFPAAILESRQNGWRTMWKNDGTDYPALLKSFLADEIKGEQFKSDYSTSVTLADALGRRFIFKHSYRPKPSPEKRLWQRLNGTFYSQTFKLSRRAISSGCRNIQDILLLAERLEGSYAREVWLLMEYIPGKTLSQCDPQARRYDVLRTVAHIHSLGLASNDLYPGNIIVAPDGELVLIDISIHSHITISQMKDVIRLEREYGDAPPFKELLLPSRSRRFLYALVKLRDSFRCFERRLLGKRDKDGKKPLEKRNGNAPPAILESQKNGWRTRWKNDGIDYPALLKSFLAGKIKGRQFKRDYSTSVTQADALGRRFIFKHYYRMEGRPEKRLWHRLTGSFYSRIFRLTRKAVASGLKNVQDIYLVSEQFEKHEAKEVWLIAEFIPGERILGHNPLARREDIFRAAAELHRFGLASNDLNMSNIIVTPENEIKIIDISINTFLIICRIKDIIYLSRKLGGEAPFREILLPSPGLRFLYWSVRARNWFRLTLRRLQGKRGKDGRKIARP